jgi:hypothetical protein
MPLNLEKVQADVSKKRVSLINNYRTRESIRNHVLRIRTGTRYQMRQWYSSQREASRQKAAEQKAVQQEKALEEEEAHADARQERKYHHVHKSYFSWFTAIANRVKSPANKQAENWQIELASLETLFVALVTLIETRDPSIGEDIWEMDLHTLCISLVFAKPGGYTPPPYGVSGEVPPGARWCDVCGDGAVFRVVLQKFKFLNF